MKLLLLAVFILATYFTYLLSLTIEVQNYTIASSAPMSERQRHIRSMIRLTNWRIMLDRYEQLFREEATRRTHQELIENAIKQGNDEKSIAITIYFSSLTNMTNPDVAEFISDSINQFLNKSETCPRWDPTLAQPAKYIFCDCTDLTVNQWEKLTPHLRDLEFGNWTLESNITNNLLHEIAVRQEHKCNRGFAWALLTMLFVKHGPEAGIQYFRNRKVAYDDGLYANARILALNRTATKLDMARSFMRLVKDYLPEEKADLHFWTMDLIVKALNGMRDFNGDHEYLLRLQQSLFNEAGLTGTCPGCWIDAGHIMAFLFICVCIGGAYVVYVDRNKPPIVYTRADMPPFARPRSVGIQF